MSFTADMVARTSASHSLHSGKRPVLFSDAYTAISLICIKELKRFTGHPLTLFVSVLLLIITVINGITGNAYLWSYNAIPGGDTFLVGLGNTFNFTAEIFMIMAAFIGVICITEERSSHSMDVLLNKPVYRRDVVIGKFLGATGFIALLIVNTLVLSLLLALFFRAPLSLSDFLLRMAGYNIALSLECWLTTGIAMLIGVLFNNIIDAIAVVITYLYVEWYFPLMSFINSLRLISSRWLCFTIISGSGEIGLFDSSMPYLNWLNVSMPYILLILLEIILVLLLGCAIFIRKDEA